MMLVRPNQIRDLANLSPHAREVIASADEIRTYGFGELCGYVGRKMIWAAGAYRDGDEFVLENLGNGQMIDL